MGNGKEWRIVVNEKYGSVEATIFDSKKVYKELNRPSKAVELFLYWLKEQACFNFESLALKVVGLSLNRPLVFRGKEDDE